MLILALVARLGVEVADKKKTLAMRDAKATDAASDATERQRANDAIVAQTPYLSALGRVRLKMGECFQVLLVELLAKHVHNALDSTLDYAVRDYTDKERMKLRGQVCNGFRAESSLIYIVRRTPGINGADHGSPLSWVRTCSRCRYLTIFFKAATDLRAFEAEAGGGDDRC